MSIIWLNGPFGAGKSSAARALRWRLPDSVVVNPEIPGWIIRRTIGRVRRGDYQERWAWRAITVFMLIQAQRFGDPVIVPMSVLSPSRMAGLLHDLRSRRAIVHHIVLDVSGDVLAERIRAETADHSAMEWRTHSAATYRANREALMALGETIDTTDRDRTDVAWAIERTVTAAA